MSKDFRRRRFFGTLQVARKLRNHSVAGRQMILTAYRLGFTDAWGVR